MVRKSDKGIGFWSVVAIGIGGMVGGGIFAVLGLAVQLAKGGTPVAFFLAGLVALVTSYSYARMSVTFPSQGGTVEFLNQGFGSGMITGALNVLLWISYIVMLSLYAHAFGSYGASFFPDAWHVVAHHALMSAAIVGLALLNAVGATVVGEAEEWIVGAKVTILLLFVVAGIWSVSGARIAPATWAAPLQLAAGGMIIFLAYEGFELIANTAQDVREASRTLPRAYLAAVVFVIVLYVLVSLVTVGNLSEDRIVGARDYALAVAAKPFLGQTGFVLIGVAAMLSTASAINATLYGAARVSYIIAKDGELPQELERNVWHRPLRGLIITTAAALLLANWVNLSNISIMGSAGFLIIFAAVNAANAVCARQTQSRAWLSILGAVACLAALGALVWERAREHALELWVLAAMVGLAVAIEAIYRAATGRSIRPFHQRRGHGRRNDPAIRQ
jgi:amino acid transporter